jgi:ribosome-associated toxin RatA of RatAB toxin-antitoxin module
VAESVKESTTIASDPDTIMRVAADFASYPEWNGEVKEAEVLETDEQGWGTKARYVIDAKVLSATVVLAYTYSDSEFSWELVEGDAVRRNDGTYTFTDLGDGTTEVTYELEVEPAISVPDMVKRKAAKRIVDGALEGLRNRVQSGG